MSIEASNTGSTSKRDVYATITEAILAKLQSCGPFERPWKRSGTTGLPTNAITGKAYRGSNVVTLWLAAQAKGYATDRWATFKQWLDRGATVRKGEKGTPVIWFKLMDGAPPVPVPGGSSVPDGESERKRFPLARLSWVFNADQVDGFQPEADQPLVDLTERIGKADALVASTGAKIVHGGGQAYYELATDSIRLPPREAFTGTSSSTPTEAYYSTLLHELTHWTGPRLKREFGKRFGDEAYAAEELVAELGAAFLCASLGISDSPRADHASYLAHWVKLLKHDPRAFVTASSRAAEAADFLLGAASDPGDTSHH